MASSAILITIILPTIIASTSGFKIENRQPLQTQSVTPGFSTLPPFKFSQSGASDYRSQPIVGYPKSPPPNARESGGSEDDLLPPFEDSVPRFNGFKSQYYRRSIEDVKVDPKTGYPLVADQSWKYAGGNEESLELPLEDSAKQEAVDPKTGYPLLAQPHWKDAGGDGDILALPLEETEVNFGQKKEPVDPKTGYPLKANPSWKDAGGDGEILDLPLEDEGKRSDEKAVDPKTGYPLVAEENWKDAGGDGDILEPPLEEPEVAVDPKTGYPLVAQPNWKNAGGDGDILELPLENEKEAVDPKTGYPLKAQPNWKYAGGDGDILQLPLETSDRTPVDPKTGYPLIAQPNWKEAGGNEEILQLPIEPSEEAVDPKTGYPLIAQPSWKDAGGNEEILQLPLQPSEEVVDAKTGYPLIAQQTWKYAGGDGGELEKSNIISPSQAQSRSGVEKYQIFEIFKLTELQPPPLENSPNVFNNFFSTPSSFGRKQGFQSGQNQKRSQTKFEFNDGRPIESTYTYTGPENVVVTVTRFLSDNRNHQLQPQHSVFNQKGFNQGNTFTRKQNLQNTNPNPFNFHGINGVPSHFNPPTVLQPIHQNFNKRYS